MRFLQDNTLIEEVGEVFGRYVATFLSDTHQVRADLFEEDGQLIAHVSFPSGLNATSATDSYVGALNDYARSHGFEGKLRLVYSE